ncbi:uncharacterized protein LOC129003650 [Macrosteles quadrilineatus]|uniref:uncharacterized protein LOC129003650 n=1 Tax=Macrosteles quadrilineatus TaxID=74068 RepID=UPI0023E32C97|nr:uncharacterized protein LOC129003650 [Macrosteles quadrilineatus]
MSTLVLHQVVPHPSVIRQWLRGGDVERLEAVVVQGLGHKLLGEYAADIKVRAFLKTVPSYLARIDMLHEAAVKGHLTDLQTLLKPSSDGSFTRKKLSALALSKDSSGTGLLHKAVYYGHRDMVKWLTEQHPGTVRVRDREGRSPLHYCGRASDPEWTWSILRQAGADVALLDARGRPPQHYMDHPEEAELPSTPSVVPPGRFTSGANGLVVKPANIRIWIHDRDLGRLAQVVWEGYGEKLRTETSQHNQVKNFLSAVPYIMGVIKDMHTAAINNDTILLRKRTEPPVPRQIVIAKDQNGLTPLHKAAGLGHVEMVRAVLSACPEAVGVLDREGRSPLHLAAAARGSGATYDLLLEQGADENILDKKGRVPSYYIHNVKEIDQKQLTVVPETTRTSTVFPANWEWSSLRLDWLGVKKPKPAPPPPLNNGDSAFEDETPERNSSQGNEINNNFAKEPPTRPQTYDIDVDPDEGVEEEEEDKERGYIADSDEQEGHYEAEYEEVDPEYELTNEPERRKEDKTPEEENGEKTEEETKDNEEEQADGRETSADREERLQRIIEVGSMEQLAEVVLAGDGELLAKHSSKNPDVQLFLDNIPSYMKKIEKVHTATREGNLRELQAALDRRKFAVARESKSTLRLSPLHVAVLYGRTAVVRFLTSRFPETMKVGDTKGRTPLHYAATLSDNGHYYNLMADLGGDTSVEDNNGKTAEFYIKNPDFITHEELLAEFEGRKPRENVQSPNKGLAENTVAVSGFPVFGQEEGRYLASSLGRPLIAGLIEVASRKPPDPVRYLADYLHNYEEIPENDTTRGLEENYFEGEQQDLTSPPPSPPHPSSPPPLPISHPLPIPPPHHPSPPLASSPPHNAEAERVVEQRVEEEARITTPEPPQSVFKPVQRDEFGQMILHFAMARTHGRNAVLQMLQEIDCNIALRDELYRTPRDVALQVSLVDNVEAIDRYVVSLAATGQVDKLRELLLEGYDHILDTHDDQASIVEVANERGQTQVLAFLDSIANFEDRRERLHRAIRLASDSQVHEMLRNNPGLALAKNSYSRCSLHVAVLNQHDHIVQHIASHYPQTLTVGDNLMRTPLHYAMGVERVETLSKILIQSGATRVVKDLKGRQPSYYFMNKSDVQKLQDEEDMLRV